MTEARWSHLQDKDQEATITGITKVRGAAKEACPAGTYKMVNGAWCPQHQEVLHSIYAGQRPAWRSGTQREVTTSHTVPILELVFRSGTH